MLKDLKYFFLISRPLNILISLIAFGISCFLALKKESIAFLTDPNFYLTSMTIALIAATGYWINDVYDFRIDRINKPGRTIVNAILSVKKVLTFYFFFNFLTLSVSAYFLAWKQGQYQITLINFLSVFLLFAYASFLKRISVVGNLVIAFLVSLVVVLAGYLYHTMNTELMYTIAFAFQITLLREITKDIEDIRGDLKFNLQTLPIQIGIKATKNVLLVLYVLFLLSCYLPFFLHYISSGEFLWLYLVLSILLVQIPTIWLMGKVSRSNHPEEFGWQSQYLKYLIFTGIITVLFLD